MAANPPQISPDGAYWWDGQAWQPMPIPNVPVSNPAAPAEVERPSWLADGVQMPGGPAAAPPEPVATSERQAEWSPSPAMAWAAGAPPSSGSRTTVMIAAGAVLALLIAGVGYLALRQPASQNDSGSATAPTASVTASPSAPAATSPATALPLTAQLSGEYCPVAHPGNSACWKGSLVNTGPPIGKLAFIFVLGGPYANWFANHANGTLSGFYTSPDCEVDAAHAEIVCGPVAVNQEVDVYLGGDVTARGTFRYAVKFADVSGPTPVYVNQHPDGTHDVVEWQEVIS
jgi:hypothetical protein